MRIYDKLRKLQFKYGNRAPERLMTYIVGAMAILYVADYVLGPTFGFYPSSIFYFSRDAIFSGQVWRLFTFAFLPPESGIIFIIFTLYFYYLIGMTLEREWGSFWFDVYYICGVIGTILAGLITGFATNYYLNMSLFFAFAVMHPDFQLLLFFFIPIKIKWLAILDAVLFLVSFIGGSWPERAAILAALANFLIFFGPSFFRGIREQIHIRRRRAAFQREMNRGAQDRDRWNR